MESLFTTLLKKKLHRRHFLVSLAKSFGEAIHKPLLGDCFCGKFDKIYQYPGIRFDDKLFSKKNINNSLIKVYQAVILLYTFQQLRFNGV